MHIHKDIVYGHCYGLNITTIIIVRATCDIDCCNKTDNYMIILEMIISFKMFNFAIYSYKGNYVQLHLDIAIVIM